MIHSNINEHKRRQSNKMSNHKVSDRIFYFIFFSLENSPLFIRAKNRAKGASLKVMS